MKAIVEHLLGQVDLAVVSDLNVPWRHRIESLALEPRERLTAHPGAVNLMIGGPMDGPRALALNEHFMETLRDSGLGAEEVAGASYLLIVKVFGSIALEAAELGGGPGGCSEGERIASRLEGFSAIPAGTYPLSAWTARIMAGYVSSGQYTWGLHKVLDGITRT